MQEAGWARSATAATFCGWTATPRSEITCPAEEAGRRPADDGHWSLRRCRAKFGLQSWRRACSGGPRRRSAGSVSSTIHTGPHVHEVTVLLAHLGDDEDSGVVAVDLDEAPRRLSMGGRRPVASGPGQ
jgi:hypothetical protein